MSPKPYGFLPARGAEQSVPVMGKSLGKSFGTSQQHLPWLSSPLRSSTRDEHPQLLGDVPEGPCCPLQGNSRCGDHREWGQASLSQPGICWVTGGCTQHPLFHGEESLWDHELSQENPKIRREVGLTWGGITAGDATGGKTQLGGWEGRENVHLIHSGEGAEAGEAGCGWERPGSASRLL